MYLTHPTKHFKVDYNHYKGRKTLLLFLLLDMELHIFANTIPGSTSTNLQCHVTASDLSGVRIQLTKDGVPLDYGVERIGPRPNGDGTVQMRVGVRTTMDTNKHYRCEAHSETVNKSVLFGKINIVSKVK